MNIKKFVAIFAGVALVAFGIAFLSYNLSGGHISYGINGNRKKFKGMNIKSDGSKVKIGLDGINIEDEDGTKVQINPGGIYVNDGDDVVDISPNGIIVNEEEVDIDEYNHSSDTKNTKKENVNEEKTEDIVGIKDIIVETNFVDINFIPESRDDIKIIYSGTIKANYIPKLKTKKSDDTLYISAKKEDNNLSQNVSYSNLKLDIHIPENYKENMKIVSTSGDVNLSKMNFNDLNLATVSGDINLNDLNLKDLVVSTTSGDIDSLNISADKNMFNSTSGDIEIKNLIGSVQTNTVSGDIEISYKNFNDNIIAATVSGDVNITLPKKSEFQISAQTTSGDLKSNFPITIQGKHKNSLEGTVGSSENKINIGTVSGDVNIYSK
ncbi:DUF4097 family beta strand repeat-containing protein [Sporanaerobacter acetigenes]|uniref:Putative adhesin n=1 Tax=Sporanaerobacter acetigenes DSM 13106 TaxID=1123281 RepID=A0A1M5X615_9FIRM|nr:DUF4097 family beta strand repeat-containing protein [Sporanaerobacter acetigenes]SHH95082.1 Putative adhesin [Sporanaerobacter acetigenes DSM 13106]